MFLTSTLFAIQTLIQILISCTFKVVILFFYIFTNKHLIKKTF